MRCQRSYFILLYFHAYTKCRSDGNQATNNKTVFVFFKFATSEKKNLCCNNDIHFLLLINRLHYKCLKRVPFFLNGISRATTNVNGASLLTCLLLSLQGLHLLFLCFVKSTLTLYRERQCILIYL